MGMARLFGLGFALLFASSVVASTIDVGPSDWRNYGPNGAHTSQGVRSTFGQNVRLPPTISGPTRVLPVSRNPVIPYGSIGNGLRGLARSSPQAVAASAVISGLFYGMDWLFEDGAWVKIDSVPAPGESAVHWFNPNLGDGWPSPEALCDALAVRQGGYVTQLERDPNHATNFMCKVETSRGQSWTFELFLRGGECPEGSGYNPDMGMCVITQQVPLTDADFDELTAKLPALPPGEVAGAAGDTQRSIGNPLPGYQDLTMTGPTSVSGPTSTSTSTDPATGDTTVTETSTTTNISYGDTTITTTNTTTSTTYQNGQQTGETVTTETPGELPVESGGGGASGDWPGFCDWATVVCDWLDWTREEPPPEQELPQVIDDDFYQEKQISFGSKTCPEPYPISLAPFMDTTVGVSFQPLCDFAGLIYYMVMAASYIIAAYISIGVARNA